MAVGGVGKEVSALTRKQLEEGDEKMVFENTNFERTEIFKCRSRVSRDYIGLKERSERSGLAIHICGFLNKWILFEAMGRITSPVRNKDDLGLCSGEF